jgi:tRNA-2-methylthio-N6-dimethylallyladenosine synthase
MKKYTIETFGCQMNEFDSERIAFLLEEIGYIKEDDIEKSDIIILNTCAVREKAKNKLFGHLGKYKELKKKNPGLLICVCGCTAQNLKDKIIDNFPFVDIVFGTHNISKLPLLIAEKYEKKSGICDIIEEGFDYNLEKFKRTYDFKSYIPISIGCNNFCSYCIVPFVRGKEISIKPEIIIDTAKKLADSGIIEIILVGQNVNSYGKDLEKKISFADLLEKISQISQIKRIRFMTSHPKDLSQELIDIIAKKDNIMPHIHLPLQSGSNKVLKMMNRHYTRENYLELTDLIRKNIKDCSITTDIIVGFPGEEEKDFYDTLDLVKRIKFDRAFTFIYSRREQTEAAAFEDKMPLVKKKELFKELVEIQNKISFEANQKKIGKLFKVLVEGEGSKKTLEGRLEDNRIVNFNGEIKKLKGKFIDIKITGAKSFYLIGEIT